MQKGIELTVSEEETQGLGKEGSITRLLTVVTRVAVGVGVCSLGIHCAGHFTYNTSFNHQPNLGGEYYGLPSGPQLLMDIVDLPRCVSLQSLSS